MMILTLGGAFISKLINWFQLKIDKKKKKKNVYFLYTRCDVWSESSMIEHFQRSDTGILETTAQKKKNSIVPVSRPTLWNRTDCKFFIAISWKRKENKHLSENFMKSGWKTKLPPNVIFKLMLKAAMLEVFLLHFLKELYSYPIKKT